MEKKETKAPKPAQAKQPAAEFTAEDLAKAVGLPSAAVARRWLRAAKVAKPDKGWSWPSADAAKPAVEAVRKAVDAGKSKS